MLRGVDPSGSVSFAGTMYRVGNRFIGETAGARLVGNTVQITIDGALVRTHKAHHDKTKEFGALAQPSGKPRRTVMHRSRGAAARGRWPARSGPLRFEPSLKVQVRCPVLWRNLQVDTNENRKVSEQVLAGGLSAPIPNRLSGSVECSYH